MPGVAEKIAARFAAPEFADPADADNLGDETTAGSRRRLASVLAGEFGSVPEGPPEKRLRLRAAVPVLSKYKGKRVNRKEVFDDDDGVDEAGGVSGGSSGSDSEAGSLPPPPEESDEDRAAATMTGSAGGAFGISGELEAEYDKMMRKSSKELEIMRKPSESEVVKRREEGKRLKRQLDAWNAMVEFRIHLEGALSSAHRLPVGPATEVFRAAESSIAPVEDSIAKDASSLLAELMALQAELTQQSTLRSTVSQASTLSAPEGGEPAVWAVLDSHLQKVLDWSLDTADYWKEKTRLDVRKSFKVLDQSLRLQMQSVSEVPAEKIRKRCAPPPGRHKVFGLPTDEENKTVEPDTERAEDIFDDREFYVQLLREVLGGAKAGGLSDEAKQMQLELQGRRAKKEKARAEVERRASKGRKIRYVPIEKLQSFMAPRPRNPEALDQQGGGNAAFHTLQDGAVDALLNSLFAPDSRGYVL